MLSGLIFTLLIYYAEFAAFSPQDAARLYRTALNCKMHHSIVAL